MYSFLKRKKYLSCLIFLPFFLLGNMSLDSLINNNIQNEKTSTYETLLTEEDSNYSIKQIETGARHSGVIINDSNGNDQLYTWGWNENNQLGSSEDIGNKTSTPQKVNFNTGVEDVTIEQISFGYSHSAAVLNYIDNGDTEATDHLYMWGSNEHGELTNIEPTPSSITENVTFSIPEEVTSLPEGDIEQISLGYYSSSAIVNDGNNDSLYAWGLNDDEQLGLGDANNENSYNTPQKVSELPEGDIQQIAMSNNWITGIDDSKYSAAVVDNQLYTWGDNTYGQLGTNNYENYNTPHKISFNNDAESVSQIALGNHHSGAVVNGELYTWGDNSKGQLGLGDSKTDTNYNTPQKVTSLPKGNIEQISMGANYSGAVVNDDTSDYLYTWGENNNGQLGLTEQDHYNTPQKVTFLSNGNIEQVSMGIDFTIALIDNNSQQSIYSWGNNAQKQLGPIDNSDNKSCLTPQEVFSISHIEGVENITSAFQLEQVGYDYVEISYSFTTDLEINNNLEIILEDAAGQNKQIHSDPNITNDGNNFYSGKETFNGLIYGNTYTYQLNFDNLNSQSTKYNDDLLLASTTSSSDTLASDTFVNSEVIVPIFEGYEIKEVDDTSATINLTYSNVNNYNYLNKLIVRNEMVNFEDTFINEEINIINSDFDSSISIVQIQLTNLIPKTTYNLKAEGWFSANQNDNNQQIVSSSNNLINFETTRSNFNSWYYEYWYYLVALIIIIIFMFIIATILAVKKTRWIVE